MMVCDPEGHTGVWGGRIHSIVWEREAQLCSFWTQNVCQAHALITTRIPTYMAESRRRVVVARAGTLQSAERVLVLVLVLAILAAAGPVRMMLAGLGVQCRERYWRGVCSAQCVR